MKEAGRRSQAGPIPEPPLHLRYLPKPASAPSSSRLGTLGREDSAKHEQAVICLLR